LFDYLKKKMKRGYHPKNIEQYVGTLVGMAVQSKRLKALEEQVARYDEMFLAEKSESRFCCRTCKQWFNNIDIGICEGGCKPTCQNCEDQRFCAICQELKCDYCIYACEAEDCLYVVCEECDDDDAWRHDCPSKTK
jgi:hypothetical protein